MNFKTLALALATTAIAPGAAHAAVNFTLDGITYSDGAKISGTFTTDDGFTRITNWSVTTQASKDGRFVETVYRESVGFPTFDQANFYPGDFDEDGIQDTGLVFQTPGQVLYIIVRGALTGEGGDVLGTSESDSEIPPKRRITTNLGRVAGPSSIAAVPEPATWAMMLIGFGLIGATARYRRRHSTVRYA